MALTTAPADPSPAGYAERVQGRLDLGLTFIKYDIRPQLFEDCQGMPPTVRQKQAGHDIHPSLLQQLHQYTF